MKSAEARKERREQREQAVFKADLTLTQRIRLSAADHADKIAAALVAHAIAFPNSSAMTELLNRTEGKVTDVTRVETSDPFQMTEAELAAWLAPADED